MDAAPALLAPPAPPGRRAAALLTVAVHLLLAALLVYGIRWQTQRPEAVEVELVRAPPEPVAVPPAPTPAPPPEPVKKAEPEPAPPPPRPDIALKEKQKPKPVAPKEAPRPKADPFEEQLRRDAEQLAQKRAADAAAAELDKLKAQQAAAALGKATRAYIEKIVGKIRPLIVLPPEIKGNPEAVFDVTQLPSGEILSVKLKKSSGHAGWDAATERAILKASPLPKPDKPELFSRTLELKFRPLDN